MKEPRSQQHSDSSRVGGGAAGSAGWQVATPCKPFAVFDIDGTLIRWQLYHSLTDQLARHGFIAPEIYQTMKDARMNWKQRAAKDAFSDYERSVIRVFDAALKNVNVEELEQAAEEVFGEYKDQAYTFSRDLIAELKERGYFLLAISGSPAEIVNKIAAYYGFDDWRGTTHYSKNGRFTGAKRVVAYHKDRALAELIKKHGLATSGSIGVGDTKSDIVLLEMVENPIAFNPDALLYEYARAHQWEVVIERKNVIYELRGQNGKYQLA